MIVHTFQVPGGLENAPIDEWGHGGRRQGRMGVQVPTRPLSAARRPWVGLKSTVRTFQRAEDVEYAPIEGWRHRGRRRGGRGV